MSGNYSWAYQSDGFIYMNSDEPSYTVSSFKCGDTLRVEVNRKNKWFSFYRNNTLVKNIYTIEPIDEGDLYFGLST